MAPVRPARSPAEWAVLGLVAEARTHGFAIATELAPTGSFGRIWTVRRPLVYRAIARLEADGLLKGAGSRPSEVGPQRNLVEITATGERALREWLATPVEHVRDARSLLLLKLLLLHRSGSDAGPLLERQREEVAGVLDLLRSRADTAEGFDLIVARWRLSNAEALDAFLSDLLSHGPRLS